MAYFITYALLNITIGRVRRTVMCEFKALTLRDEPINDI